MAKVEHTSDARVLVGIDISKHRHEVLIAVPGKTRRRRLTITNSTDDFMRLIAILRDYGLPVRIGFEATGNYHRVLMYHLGVAGFDLKLVSSIALARTREALHNSWDKNDPKDAQVILHMLQIGAVQIRQRNAIEDRAIELLGDRPDYLLLRTIPGIGPINALTILAETGDLRRFHHHRQFLKFCGMDLATVQSGMFRGRSKISKYGNARLRRTLWLAGQTAVLKKANSFRDKFERYIAQDRHNSDLRRKAYTAIAAKMARTIHAVIKSGEPYRPFFEGTSPGGRTPLCRAVEAGS